MSFKLLNVLVLVTLMSGCAMLGTRTYKLDPQVVTQTVKIEVPVKCQAPKIDEPTRTFDQAKKSDPLYNNLALLAAENDQLNAYSVQLKAALSKCSK